MYIDYYMPFDDFLYTLFQLSGEELEYSHEDCLAIYNYLSQESSYQKDAPYHLYPDLIFDRFTEFQDFTQLSKSLLGNQPPYPEALAALSTLGQVIPIKGTDRYLLESDN